MRLLLLLIIVLSNLAIAEGSRAPVRVDWQNQQGIANQYVWQNKADEVVWLGEENAKFLVLQKNNAAKTANGAVLIFHDNGLTPNWPQPIEKLRELLPNQGWMVLSAALPEMTDSQWQATQANEAQLEANQTFETQMLERIKLMHEYANDQGMFNLAWIAHGQSSWWVGQYMLKELNDDAAQGFYLIFYNADAPRANKMSAVIGNLNLPTLDLYQGYFAQGDDSPDARQAAANRNENSQYQQIKETQVNSQLAAVNDRLVRRIWGWLKANAQGSQAKLKVE